MLPGFFWEAYLAGRFGIIDEMRVIPGAEGRDRGRDIPPPVRGYRGVLGRPVLRMLRDVVRIDPVVFGTDYPYLRRDLAGRAATTSRPPRNSPMASGRPSSAPRARR